MFVGGARSCCRSSLCVEATCPSIGDAWAASAAAVVGGRRDGRLAILLLLRHVDNLRTLFCVRKYLLIGLLAVTACGSAEGLRSASKPGATSTTASTTTTAAPPPTTAPRPTDPEGLRCQAAVDATVNDLRLRGVVPDDLDAVCRTTAEPVLAQGNSGAYVNPRVLVLYPLKRTTGQESFWHDVVAHEVGHAWDAHELTTAQRVRYSQIRGLALYDGEDYADVFAAIIGGATFLPRIGGSPPPPEQVAAICAERLVPC